VVLNRVRSSLYPDTICGVVYQGQNRRTGCQFSFTCDGRADVPKDMERWRLANEIAKKTTEGESFLSDIGHATHYHANYVSPGWRRELNKIKKVGRHIFYRVRGEQIEDVLKEESPARGLAFSKNG
jgi:spore germination cell wall hydrolase CwlJ-like protein